MEKSKDIIGNEINAIKNANKNFSKFNTINEEFLNQTQLIYQGGGPIAIQKQHNKKRMISI